MTNRLGWAKRQIDRIPAPILGVILLVTAPVWMVGILVLAFGVAMYGAAADAVDCVKDWSGPSD